jgi:excinuclease ABC subunit A
MFTRRRAAGPARPIAGWSRSTRCRGRPGADRPHAAVQPRHLYGRVFGEIRDLFAQLPEAKIRGYKPGRFSFNVKGGRCEDLRGRRLDEAHRNALPARRLTSLRDLPRAALQPRNPRGALPGKSIADVLEMTVEEACEFFELPRRSTARCKTLDEVGPRLHHAGPAAPPRSAAARRSGSSWRRNSRKKARERPSTSSTSRPPGCISRTSAKLLEVLHRAGRQGNTVIVIEHNLDVIKIGGPYHRPRARKAARPAAK